MSKIRVGIIGDGGIVRRLHLPDLTQNDNFEVVLISGRKEHRLKQQCDEFNIPNWTTDYEAVISDQTLWRYE
jgi:predicted dehydrogenase